MLLRGDVEEITSALRSMEQEISKMETEIMTLLIHLKGGISLHEAYNMSGKQFETAVIVMNDYYTKYNDALNSSSR